MTTKNDGFDATYLYFKPAGKWKYEGRGHYPEEPFFARAEIKAANNGEMPGITSGAEEYVIVIIPDEDCDKPYAYPRMLTEVTR